MTKAFDRKLESLEALRSAADSPDTLAALRKSLHDRSNYFVSRCAALIAQLNLTALAPDLAAAFDRFLLDPVKSDPQCWAKNAIVKALKDLGYNDASFFLRGLHHHQPEPVWGGSEDTATVLRGACALALVTCPLPRLEILTELADLLAADDSKTVRAEAALAIAQLSGPDSLLLLRFKALAGDRDPEVVGQCLVSLLQISPGTIPFVAKFLDSSNPDLPYEAVAALGSCDDPLAVSILIDRYRATEDSQLIRAILLSLGASRSSEAAAFLLTVLRDAPFEPACHAIRALAAGRFRDEFRTRAEWSTAARHDPRLTELFEKEFN